MVVGRGWRQPGGAARGRLLDSLRVQLKPEPKKWASPHLLELLGPPLFFPHLPVLAQAFARLGGSV